MKLYEFTHIKIQKEKSTEGPVHLYTSVILIEMNLANNAYLL